MEGPEVSERRGHERVGLGGGALLMTDPRRGLISVSCDLIDVSEGGCRLRVYCRVDAHCGATVRLELAGTLLWFPVVIRWVQHDEDGWTVGCVFEPLTSTMQDALRMVLVEHDLRRALIGPARRVSKAVSDNPAFDH